MTEDAITREEMTFFLSGGVVIAGLPENPVTWLTDKSWGEICRVQTLPNFTNFQFSFTRNVDAWKEYYDLLNPEKAPIPEPWEEKLTPFQKLIIMRMIRTDKVMIAVIKIFFFFIQSLSVTRSVKKHKMKIKWKLNFTNRYNNSSKLEWV